jgi:two-component system, cell cycle sensor histidine kinase and response regulator CckA
MSENRPTHREQARLAALHQYAIVDTPPEPVFDGIARIAARICDTPIAMVTFIDEGHQSIKARVGIDLESTPRDESFCTNILDDSVPMVVEDATRDARFVNLPLVSGPSHIRFYAGAPIRTAAGFGLGAVCVLDTRPRQLQPFQLAALEALADDVMARLEARRATVSLVEANTKFAAAQRIACVGSWETDVATGALSGSDELHRLLGVTPGSMTQTEQFRTFVHPDDRARVFAARQATEDAGSVMSVKHRIVRANGEVRWVHTQGEVQPPDANGRVVFAGTVQDITTGHEREIRLREQAALIDAARDAIMVRDMDNVILSWNGGAERIFGWTAAEAIGKDALTLLHREPAAFARAMTQLTETGHWSGELRKRTKTGENVIVEGSWTLLRHEDGRPKSVLVINTDVTDKRKLEVQFLRAQRMESIGTLAGGIAHDLNNMLAPILMSIELLRMSITDASAGELLGTIETSARRGADLVKQVLTFARGVEGQREDLAVQPFLDDLVKLARDTFPRAITVVATAAPDLWWVKGDRTQLQQVLLNLAVNARDAMPMGGRLDLSAVNITLDTVYAAMTPEAKVASYVMIEVSDTGLGIPAEIRERIFEPFFTTKGVGDGTGLGLATVQAIVRSHRGFVTVYSEPGHGTTFKVYLPAIGAVAQRSDWEAADTLPRGHGELILVVDDEAAIRDVTKQTLEAFGYTVLTAADGADALATYTRQDGAIAAILTDIMMPVMDGPALIQAVRRIDPAIPIIAASGLAASGSDTAPMVDVNHFLPKPYTADAMLRALRAALGTRPTT